MKTNRRKPFILATLALGLVLVMGLGANTFAKYITTNNNTDSARVAVWGVDIEVDAATLFSAAYNQGAPVEATATNDVVSANATDFVVAPGTADAIAYADAVTLTGEPEVDVLVTITAVITDNVVAPKAEIGAEVDYRPIVWKDGAEVVDVSTGTATVTKTTRLEANTDLATADIDFPAINWAWAFGTGATDVADTWLGDNADGKTVSVQITVTVEQVQTAG